MPADMTVTEFSSDDEEFTMSVEVLDKNAAIGIMETLRTFDSVDYLVVETMADEEEKIEEDKVAEILERLALENEEALDGADAAEVKEEIEEDEEAEDDEEVEENALPEEENTLTVASVGTYRMRVDSETGEKYLVRKYVSLTVTCVYRPAEEVVIENNVEVPEEAAN